MAKYQKKTFTRNPRREQEQREIVNAEINGLKQGGNFVAKYIPVDTSIYRKTHAEKQTLKEIRGVIKKTLRKQGLNPKRVMNI